MGTQCLAHPTAYGFNCRIQEKHVVAKSHVPHARATALAASGRMGCNGSIPYYNNGHGIDSQYRQDPRWR